MSAPDWGRALLSPLTAVYGMGVAAKNHAYDHGHREAQRLAWPVISVGNLSTGGAGKTPFTAELARLLLEHGVHVDILSRGYGRRSPVPVERVPPGSGDAARFGDEPLLLARATGAPVYVGASRYAAGLVAERDAQAERLPRAAGGPWPAAVHLLDDGFQHRQLARAVDIVLLHPRDCADTLLPSGRLREGLATLRRAAFIVLREGDDQSEPALARAGVRSPIWRVRRSLRVPAITGSVVAFAAIAHPEEFFASLRSAGLTFTQTFDFQDHHRFLPREIKQIAKAAQGSSAILTTEKDLVRLGDAATQRLSCVAPLHAVPLITELLEAPECLFALRTALARRG